jgi:hypothetical protein
MAAPAARRPDSRRLSRRVGWRFLVALAGTVAIVVVLGLALAGTYRPRWYHPAPVDRARLREDKAALVSLEEQISAALNAGQEVRFELREDQLNRWLAARGEIWPELAADLGPFQQPQVLLRDGRIQVAARTRKGGLTVVAALTCSVDVTDDTLLLRYDAPRLGAIPAPRGWASGVLARLPAGSGVAVDQDAGAVAVDNDWVWPNGKRRCRLRELHIADGVATVVLEPLRAGPRLQ